MKTILLFSAVLLQGALSFASGSWDHVSNGALDINNPNAEVVLTRTVNDLKALFEIYRPAIGGGVKIVRPKRVTGTMSNPRMTMSIEKCLGIFCQTVDLVGDASIKPTTGQCKLNWLIDLDISKSSAIVSDLYDRLQVEACYNGITDQTGKLKMIGKIRRGNSYEEGDIQQAILEVLRGQFEPLSQALIASMKRH